jgi:carboxymethylenebutenolidase
MGNVNTSDLHPEVWKLFDRYVHGLIDRRGFLDGTAKYAAGGMTAVGILEALSPKYAEAQQVAPSDPRIKTERVDVKSPEGYGTIRALVARPANATGRIPAVVVIHENRGLNPHIEDVVRRAAVAGFMAIGPDALTAIPAPMKRGPRCSASSSSRR